VSILCKTRLFDIRAKLKRSKQSPPSASPSYRLTSLTYTRNNNIVRDVGFSIAAGLKKKKTFKCGINIYNV
jgi:hypothetical protein